MLAAQICRELHFGVIASRMQSRVPRCLFGAPNPRDTMELLQEALETERSRFAKRWGVDPLAEDEDKENIAGGNNILVVRSNSRQQSCSPTKRRSSPYAKQTSIHDYWRSRKVCDSNKKSSAFVEVNGSTRQPAPPSEPQSPPQQQQQNDKPSTSSNQ